MSNGGIHSLEIQLGKVPALSRVLINGTMIPVSRLEIEQDAGYGVTRITLDISGQALGRLSLTEGEWRFGEHGQRAVIKITSLPK